MCSVWYQDVWLYCILNISLQRELFCFGEKGGGGKQVCGKSSSLITLKVISPLKVSVDSWRGGGLRQEKGGEQG